MTMQLGIDFGPPARVPSTDATADGRRARDRIVARQDDAQSAIIEEIRVWLRRLYMDRRVAKGAHASSVSGDDASEYLDARGYEGERRVLGAVFRPGSGWQRVGYAPSRLARRHARPVALWAWVGVESTP